MRKQRAGGRYDSPEPLSDDDDSSAQPCAEEYGEDQTRHYTDNDAVTNCVLLAHLLNRTWPSPEGMEHSGIPIRVHGMVGQ